MEMLILDLKKLYYLEVSGELLACGRLGFASFSFSKIISYIKESYFQRLICYEHIKKNSCAFICLLSKEVL